MAQIDRYASEGDRKGDEMSAQDALEQYLLAVEQSRSPLTHKSYSQAARCFDAMLHERGVSLTTTPVAHVTTEWMAWFIETLHDSYAVATEKLYLTALNGFYEYVAAEGWAAMNLPALKQLRQRRARREAARLPPFPRDEIEKILSATAQAATVPNDPLASLRNLRDRALLFVLADTGLRVAEACDLLRGHIDWQEARAAVLGKGNQEAVVRFSARSMRYMRAYLDARAELDGAQGRPLRGLPLFARHDRGAGKRILPLSPRSAEKVVEGWVLRVLGREARGAITPHTFRHYFVTVVLRGTGGNIRIAQELARHRSIVTTQRYTHLSDGELDQGYHEIFNK